MLPGPHSATFSSGWLFFTRKFLKKLHVICGLLESFFSSKHISFSCSHISSFLSFSVAPRCLKIYTFWSWWIFMLLEAKMACCFILNIYMSRKGYQVCNAVRSMVVDFPSFDMLLNAVPTFIGIFIFHMWTDLCLHKAQGGCWSWGREWEWYQGPSYGSWILRLVWCYLWPKTGRKYAMSCSKCSPFKIARVLLLQPWPAPYSRESKEVCDIFIAVMS